MRSISLSFALAALLLSTGCVDSKWAFLRPRQEAPQASSRKPTAGELVAYMNRNATLLTSLQCTHVDLECKYRLQQYHVGALMYCERPKNFHLRATALGKTEADIGSNRDEFWFWIARNNPPYLMHCSYQALEQGGVQLPFPVQPDWVMEALGMAEYPVDGRYRLDTYRDRWELIQDSTSQGRRVQKVTVFDNRYNARVPVRAHILKDERGQVICAAYIRDAVQVGDGGPLVPRKIDLEYRTEHLHMQFKLFDDLADVVLNQPIDAQVFARPNLSGVQSYDLSMNASQLSPAGGYLPTR